MSNPMVFTKKTFLEAGNAWTEYYKDNKFEAYDELQKALKYVPIYYQEKRRTAAALAYSLWSSANQRFEVFCPTNPIFRSTNLHELGHIYFGHLRNSRTYISMCQKLLKKHERAVCRYLKLDSYDFAHDVINVCMDLEINSKLFRTPLERKELNKTVHFYLKKFRDGNIRQFLKDFNPEDLPDNTVIYFPSDLGLPEGKSFIEYVQLIVDKAEKSLEDFNKKQESYARMVAESLNNNSSLDTDEVVSTNVIPNNEHFEEDEEEEDNLEDEDCTISLPIDSGENKGDTPTHNTSENDTQNEIDDEEVGERFATNNRVNDLLNRLRRQDKDWGSNKNPQHLYEDLEGETLETVIGSIEDWSKRHDREEEELANTKSEIDVATSFNELNKFILTNAVPSMTEHQRNDILYNYNRGKTTNVFINKIRTNTSYRKPIVHIFTDVSGSMDEKYTKSVVKAVKTIASKIDNKSSITFYESYPRNTEKLATITDKIINESFTGGGTELAVALERYVSTTENMIGNTIVIISDFEDDFEEIKAQLKNIHSRVLCIEVCQPIDKSQLADECKAYNITNTINLKVVERRYAA